MPVKVGHRIRRRVIPIPTSASIEEGRFFEASLSVPSGSLQGWNPGQVRSFFPDAKFQSAKVTQDALHPGPPYKTGGDFFSSSVTNEYDPSAVLGNGTYLNSARPDWINPVKRVATRKWVGGFRPPQDLDFGMETNLGSIMTLGTSTIPDLTSWGDKAWSKTKPKLEKASAFVFVAEMRDIPKMLKESAGGFYSAYKSLGGIESKSWAMAPKRAADQFLNHQFGWAPFLRDIAALHKVVENYTAYLENISKLNGRSLRRRVTLSDEKTTTVLSSGSGYPAHLNSTSGGQHDWFVSIPTWEITEEIQTTVTAVGRWRYYSPAFDTAMADYAGRWKEIRRFMTIYGLRVTPSNVYKVIPWSWLVDWVSNLGDQIDLISDELVDETVAQYLYVMQHQVVRRKIRKVFPFHSGTVTCEWSRVKETKTRQGAQSPYGFSLSWSFLDPRKLMILGALGISKYSP